MVHGGATFTSSLVWDSCNSQVLCVINSLFPDQRYIVVVTGFLVVCMCMHLCSLRELDISLSFSNNYEHTCGNVYTSVEAHILLECVLIRRADRLVLGLCVHIYTVDVWGGRSACVFQGCVCVHFFLLFDVQ